MTPDSGLGLRLLAASMVSLLVVGLAVAVSGVRAAPPDATRAAPAPAATPAPSPAPSPEPSPDASTPQLRTGELPTEPDVAEQLGAERLLAAGIAVAAGPWRSLSALDEEPEERPVYVATARIDRGRRRVTADVVVAVRPAERADELVLRLLPGARPLAEGGPRVSVRYGGRAAAHRVDRDGARLLVSLDPPAAAGQAILVRVRLGYDLVDRRSIDADGGPAGFGLLAWNEDVSVLGHWLPLLTHPGDDGPMLPIGDVGAFPAAVWSVIVEADGHVVGGGAETPCPHAGDTPARLGCTWLRGIALREVAVTVFDGTLETAPRGTIPTVRVATVPGAALDAEAAAGASERAVRRITDLFGPLAWPDVDVAIVPLSDGVAGMEFPGLLLVDSGIRDPDGFVLVHELAHQWFHALVGSGSLSAPVVDESLAQYLTYLWWVEERGEEVAAAMADAAFRDRYERARAAGLRDEPPGQPLSEFDSAAAYGALVYSRGALTWLAAEEEVGRDTVLATIRDVVARHRLGFAEVEDVIRIAGEHRAALADVLERYWLVADPVEADG